MPGTWPLGHVLISRVADNCVAEAPSLLCVAPTPGCMSAGIIRTKLSEAANRTVVPYGVPVSAIVQVWSIDVEIILSGPNVWSAFAITYCWHAAVAHNAHDIADMSHKSWPG
jgi:hypothetical protein